MALNNLPSGRTSLSNVKECEHWEPEKDGTFQIQQYRTIEQTEILSGNLLVEISPFLFIHPYFLCMSSELEIDSRNPTIAEFITKTNKAAKKRTNTETMQTCNKQVKLS